MPVLRGSKGVWRAGLAQKLWSGLSPAACSMLGTGVAPLLPVRGSGCPTLCGTPFLLDVCMLIDLSVSNICVCLCGMGKPGTALLLCKHLPPKILNHSDISWLWLPPRAPLQDVPSWFSTCTMPCAKPWGSTRPCWGHGTSCPIPTRSERTVPPSLPRTTDPFSPFQSHTAPKSHWAESRVRPRAFSLPPPCVNPSATSRRLHPHPSTSHHALSQAQATDAQTAFGSGISLDPFSLGSVFCFYLNQPPQPQQLSASFCHLKHPTSRAEPIRVHTPPG